MDKKLLDKYHEEVGKRFGSMTDQVQIIFFKLTIKFCNEDRPLKKDEKIIAVFKK